jgi:hypothetical protein
MSIVFTLPTFYFAVCKYFYVNIRRIFQKKKNQCPEIFCCTSNVSV